jgi:hypothetical protein
LRADCVIGVSYRNFMAKSRGRRPKKAPRAPQRSGNPAARGLPVGRCHCILTLPGDQRFVDATVGQYPQIAQLRLGPICGRSVTMAGGSAAQRAALAQSGRMPHGAHMAVQRQNLTLLYTLASDTATQVILRHPSVQDHRQAHRRAGINLAALALQFLRRPGRYRPRPPGGLPTAARAPGRCR